MIDATEDRASILLCTDLDRTLLPNGSQPETPGSLARFAALAAHPGISLAYVSGRHQELVLDAIEDYQIPTPDYVIGDVGTSIYSVHRQGWRAWMNWIEDISPDWSHQDSTSLATLFHDLDFLRLQEPEKQNVLKLSYYVQRDLDTDAFLALMEDRLQRENVHANLIWSIDEATGNGLLDILPRRASKRHAIEFLMAQEGFTRDRTVFCGDSGNDLAVLISPIPGVLVANAAPEVRLQAIELAKYEHNEQRLYVARGDFYGMNGNYSAGILEGVAHYYPETPAWWN